MFYFTTLTISISLPMLFQLLQFHNCWLIVWKQHQHSQQEVVPTIAQSIAQGTDCIYKIIYIKLCLSLFTYVSDMVNLIKT